MNSVISVITVCYNCKNDIEPTILSVINQTYNTIEFIIIDGGSTDGTLEIIKKYRDKINVLVSEPDNGIYDAMNKGLKLATGKWGIFLNSGDSFAEKDTLLKVYEYIIDRKDEDFVFIVGSTKRIYEKNKYFISTPHFFCSPSKGMGFSHQSVFFKVSLHKAMPFSEEFKLMGDLDFFCNCYNQGYNYIQVPITISNFVTGGISRQKWKTNVTERYRIFKKYINFPSLFDYLLLINTILRFIIVTIFIGEGRLKKIKSIFHKR